MIIDSHAHVGPKIQDPLLRSKMASNPEGTAEHYIAAMDKAGVHMGVTFGFLDVDSKYQAEIQKRYPDRIISCAWINPRKADAADEFKMSVEEWGIRGLKLHGWWHQFSNADHTLLDPLMVVCDKYKLPVIMHGMGDNCFTTPLQLEEMARSYPEVPFVMGHGGNIWLADEAILVAGRNKNVYMDTAAMEGYSIAKAVEVLGADKMLMGSDWPWNFLPGVMGWVQAAVSDAKDREWVMGRTAAKLFGIEWSKRS